jgi:hypothetical protein
VEEGVPAGTVEMVLEVMAVDLDLDLDQKINIQTLETTKHMLISQHRLLR